MHPIIGFLIGMSLTFLITYALLHILLKIRAKKLLAIEIPGSNIRQLIIKPIVIFMAIYYGIYAIIPIIILYVSQLKTLGVIIGYIGFFIGLFSMQKILKQNLIKEGLDDEKAKKLSGSVVSYYFGYFIGIATLLSIIYFIVFFKGPWH